MKRVVSLIILLAGIASAQEAGWPRTVKAGRTELVVYQPQPDSFDGTTLQTRVAISVKRAQDEAPIFGAVWAAATLEVDSARDRARVVSVHIDRTRFESLSDSELQPLVKFLQADVPLWNLSISLTKLKASLEPADSEYRNDPPHIVIADHPAILLLLDGEPQLRDAGPGGLQSVVNTALPVIFDPSSRQYWLYGSSVWFTTSDLLHGDWSPANNAPANIAALVKDSNVLKSAQEDAGKAASPAQLRKAAIVVATEPTELIVTDGAPKYSPLGDGDVLYVTNTDNDIFMEVATQRTFVLLSGRWYAAPSLTGHWSFIAPEKLPQAFAKIPGNSPKASALAFVPGTDRARDALLDNAIPQTAEVSRRDASLEVQYDGAPQFAPIPNTSLEYAENTPSQIIRSNRSYYACEDGVWYAAPSPQGPWAVSDLRPPGVEDIPPSSPAYNLKYVYIYDSTPDFVRVGYLPGYRWSLPYHGVVFYGTGWHYRGWFGHYYYPRPATWGFFAHYNPWTGWNFGMSWVPGWLGLTSNWGWGWAGWQPYYGIGYRPGYWSGHYAGGWFGPGGYRPPRSPSWRPPVRPGGGRPTIQPYPGPNTHPGKNLYTKPDRGGGRPRPGTLPGGPRPGRPNNAIPNGRGPGRPTMGSPSGRGPGRPNADAPNPQPAPRGGRRPDGKGSEGGSPGRGAQPPPASKSGPPGGRGPRRPPSDTTPDRGAQPRPMPIVD